MSGNDEMEWDERSGMEMDKRESGMEVDERKNGMGIDGNE